MDIPERSQAGTCFEVGSESGVMRGFQKGIALGGETRPLEVLEKFGVWVVVWSSDNRVSKVKSSLSFFDFLLTFS